MVLNINKNRLALREFIRHTGYGLIGISFVLSSDFFKRSFSAFSLFSVLLVNRMAWSMILKIRPSLPVKKDRNSSVYGAISG